MNQDEIKSRIAAQTALVARQSRELIILADRGGLMETALGATPNSVHLAQQIYCNVVAVVTLCQCLEKPK